LKLLLCTGCYARHVPALGEAVFCTAEILFYFLVAVLSINLYLQWTVKKYISDNVGLPEYSG